MNYWLLKTEPGTYSFDDIVADGGTRWDGVSNPLALKHIRSMSKGDLAFIYHSGDEKAIVGIARITRGAYQDPKSQNPRMSVVDLRGTKRLSKKIPLAEIKKRKEFASFDLVRISRLSVMPVPKEMWTLLMAMAGDEEKVRKP